MFNKITHVNSNPDGYKTDWKIISNLININNGDKYIDYDNISINSDEDIFYECNTNIDLYENDIDVNHSDNNYQIKCLINNYKKTCKTKIIFSNSIEYTI